MKKKLEISVGYYSDKGKKNENQDFCGWMIPEPHLLQTKGAVALLADGVSCCDSGAEASEFAVKSFINDYFSTSESWTVKTSAQKILSATNSWLFSEGQRRQESRRGLVTTLSALILKSTTGHLFHVGDSCIVKISGMEVETLTRPHRVQVSAEREYLSRAMGADSDLEIDCLTVPLMVGDFFLLMSDGVRDFVPDSLFVEQLQAKQVDPDLVAKNICNSAINNSSLDNVTCMVVEVKALPSQDVAEVCQDLTTLPFPPELQIGMVLDGYRIVAELHSSSTSQLYRARDEINDKVVVIKTPSVNFSDDPAYIERFYHEEWAGKRMDSHHVMDILEVGQRRHFLYMVLESLDGMTLQSWMEDNPLAEITKVQELLAQIVNGVRVFHRLEMLHRDLKPQNIFITKEGLIKIIDFGSVKIGGIAEIATPIQREENLGTKSYSAPEYFANNPGTKRSDIYSIGVIVYEMLTGRLPYAEGDTKRECYIPASTHNPLVPTWMDGAIAKAVQQDPKLRYDLLSEFVQDFTHPNPQLAKEKHIPLIQRNPMLVWQVMTGLLLLLNLVLFFLLNSSTP
ncbi:MAG: bifunctional protein-serine/threonine kinase/phosphatase [Magnetococcales bacterium]|nr:bifunctional protein-serine/threonine kinase/phosphatase [Magnetococcales bacterium]